MSIKELCVKYFQNENIYEILGINRESNVAEVNKAYREWSLKVHPDRVSADKKEEAGEKFKLITKIKNILSNEHSKSIYDRTGVLIDFDRNDSSNSYVSAQLMEQVAESYKGSEREAEEIKEAYTAGSGCINFIFEMVPFVTIQDEGRIINMISRWIEQGVVPDFDMFSKEPKAKRVRRHKKFSKQE